MSQVRRDKRREKYSRNTQGWNAQGFFSQATPSDYSTETTLQAFVYNEAESVIGLYSKAGALLTTPIAAGDIFSILQKNSDDTVKRSTALTGGQYTVIKTPFDAAVIQQDRVGFNGTDGNLNINIVGGLQEFVLSIRERTPTNQPFPVMEGRAIVRGGSPLDYDIAVKIANDIKNSFDFERNADNNFAIVNIITDIAGTQLTGTLTLTLTDGSNQVFTSGDLTAQLTAGDYLIETASLRVYKMLSVSATTLILDQRVSLNVPSGTTTQVATLFATADQTAMDPALIGFDVQGKDELVHFTTSVSEDLGDADITLLANWNFGSGEAFQVASIEDESAVFDGWTTINEAFVRDYGAPDLWVDDSSTTEYALYIIEATARIIPSSGAPQNQTLMLSNFIIAAVEGSDLETNLDNLFGT